MVVTVREIMAPTPITARPEATVREVARIMRDEDIGSVLIADDDRLLGLVTDRDLVVRTLAVGAVGETPCARRAASRCTASGRTPTWSRPRR